VDVFQELLKFSLLLRGRSDLRECLHNRYECQFQASSLRDRVVDVAEELLKFSLLLRGNSDFLVDRFSERQEKREKGRLLSQAEKEALKDAQAKG